MENRPYVPWKQMESFLIDAFCAYGVPREDAVLCADVLLESDRRGIESHGCNRFKPIYLDRIECAMQKPVTKIDILKETPGDCQRHSKGDRAHNDNTRRSRMVFRRPYKGDLPHGKEKGKRGNLPRHKVYRP